MASSHRDEGSQGGARSVWLRHGLEALKALLSSVYVLLLGYGIADSLQITLERHFHDWIESPWIPVVRVVFSALIFSTATYTFFFCSRWQKEAWAEARARGVGRRRYASCGVDVVLWVLIHTAVSLSAGGNSLAAALCGMAERHVGLPLAASMPAAGVLIAGAAYGLIILARDSALRGWDSDGGASAKRVKTRRRLPSALRMIIRLAVAVPLYVLAVSVSPFVYAALRTAAFLAASGKVIGVILGVVLVILAIIYGRALSKRRKFLRGLRRVCRERGFELSQVRRPYLSVFADGKGSFFTVTAGSKTYDVRLLSCVSRSTVMAFSPSGEGVSEVPVKLRGATLFAFRTRFPFTVEKTAPDSIPLVVLVPVPGKLLIGEEGSLREGDTGDRVGEYIIYNGSGFLNALERDCIGKR